MRLLITAFVLLSITGSAAAADSLSTSANDTAIVIGGATLWIASEVAKPDLAPARCRWCEPEVNTLDRTTRDAVKSENTKPMALVSDVGLYAVMPLSAGLLTLRSKDAKSTALLVTEGLVITSTVNQALKFSFGRSRPYARFRNDVGADPAKGDDHLSFFSGHTAVSFSLAASSYAWMRKDDPEAAPIVGGLLFAGAATVGFARIAADRHYLTDVLAGAIVGSAIGWWTIESHRVTPKQSVSLDASPRAVLFTWKM